MAMEPVFGVLQLIDISIQVASKTKSIYGILADSDDLRVKQIHFKLVAQQEITARWASQMQSGITSSHKLRNKIPQERVQEMKQLLEEMKAYYDLAESKMERIRPGRDGRMSSHVLAHRIRFASGGYEELLRLADTLEAMNKALEAIAPSTQSQFGNSNSASQGPSSGYITPETHAPYEGAAPSIRPDTSIDNISKGLDVESILVKISELFEQCLTGLRLMMRLATDRPLVATIHRRLEGWGRDLFTNPSTIDEILVGPEENLRDAIIRALVFIAVIEEILMSRPSVVPDDQTQRSLSSQRSKTMALLGTGSLADIALEYWSKMPSVLDNDTPLLHQNNLGPDEIHPESSSHWDKEAASDLKLHEDDKIVDIHESDGPDDFYGTQLRELKTQTQELQRIVETSVDDSRASSSSLELLPDAEPKDSNEDIIHQLYHTVDLLFDILPSIRSLRRTSLLRQEELAAELEKTKADTSLAPDTGESSRQRELPAALPSYGMNEESSTGSLTSEKPLQQNSPALELDNPKPSLVLAKASSSRNISVEKVHERSSRKHRSSRRPAHSKCPPTSSFVREKCT